MNLARAVRLTKLRLIIAVALAVAAVLAFSSQAAFARPGGSRVSAGNGGPKPVIVLVHGAWADASSWDGVIQRLQGDGFTVYAPPNPLRGLSGIPASDPAYLHDFLTQNAALAGKPIVLVGHSYGGAVITNAAVGGVSGPVSGTGLAGICEECVFQRPGEPVPVAVRRPTALYDEPVMDVVCVEGPQHVARLGG